MRDFLLKCALIALCFDIFVSGKSDAKYADTAKVKGRPSSLSGAGKHYRTTSSGKQRTDKHISKGQKAPGTAVSTADSKHVSKGKGAAEVGKVKGPEKTVKTKEPEPAEIEKKLNEYQAALVKHRDELMKIKEELRASRENSLATLKLRHQRNALEAEISQIRKKQRKLIEDIRRRYYGGQKLGAKSAGAKSLKAGEYQDREGELLAQLDVLHNKRMDLIEQRDTVEEQYEASHQEEDRRHLRQLIDNLTSLLHQVEDEMIEKIDELEKIWRDRENLSPNPHALKKASVATEKPAASSVWGTATSAISGFAAKLIGQGKTAKSESAGGVPASDKDDSGDIKEATVSCSDLQGDPKKCEAHEACMSIDMKGDISTMVLKSMGHKNGQCPDPAKSPKNRIIEFFAIVTGATEETISQHACVLSPEYMAKIIDTDCKVISRTAARMVIRVLHAYHVLTGVEVARINENEFLTDICRVAAYKYFTAPIGVIALWIYEYNKIKGTPLADATCAAAGPPPTNNPMGLSQWAEKALRSLYASAPWRQLKIYQQYVRAAPQLHKVADDETQENQATTKRKT